MSTYSNWLQPDLQNLLQRVVRFFHPRSSCTTTHISADVQRITLNPSCMTISGGRTKQLYIFCRVTGFMSDFLSFIVVELNWFFHGAIQLFLVLWSTVFTSSVTRMCLRATQPLARNSCSYFGFVVSDPILIHYCCQVYPTVNILKIFFAL